MADGPLSRFLAHTSLLRGAQALHRCYILVAVAGRQTVAIHLSSVATGKVAERINRGGARWSFCFTKWCLLINSATWDNQQPAGAFPSRKQRKPRRIRYTGRADRLALSIRTHQ